MVNIPKIAADQAAKNAPAAEGSSKTSGRGGPPSTGSTPGRGIASTLERLGRAFEEMGLPLADWPSPPTATFINVAQVVAWTALALVILPGRGHFTYDQAYFYELSVRVTETLRPPAYGPFVSGTDPAALTPGGSLYLVYSIPFFIFRDPRVGVGWIILLSAAGLLLIDRSLVKLGSPSSLRLALVSTLTWSLWHGRFTDTFWGPNLFLFSTPALLYATVRIARDESPAWYWSVLFGLLSALSLQIHASGSLAIAACGLVWATQRTQRLRLSWIGLALLGFTAAYIPYLRVELRDYWVDSRLLQRAIPAGFDSEAIWRSLGAWLLYPSHAQTRKALAAFSSGDWHGQLFGASLVLGAALSVLGLGVAFRPKWVPVLLVLALPLYFRVTGRPYYDHYVVAALPFFCLPAAAGAASLLSSPLWRWLAITYFGAFAAAGIALLVAGQEVLRPNDRWNGQTVEFQLARTRRAIANNTPVLSGTLDEAAFVEWVVARRLFGRPLLFQVESHLCDVAVWLSGVNPPIEERADQLLVPLAANSVFVCERKRF
ncbi:MAG TPA: hypothetical protein VEM39_03460 [Myxococcaceae bacterium]|nr:hypothetical protein [Myxococcaceae bacterium]